MAIGVLIICLLAWDISLYIIYNYMFQEPMNADE